MNVTHHTNIRKDNVGNTGHWNHSLGYQTLKTVGCG